MDTTTVPGTNSVDWAGITSVEELNQIWPVIEPKIAAALEYSWGEMIPNDYGQRICDQTMQLWLIFDVKTRETIGLLLTEIVNYPRVRVCNVTLVNGERMDEWFPYLETLEDWARQQGAEQLRWQGREGFIRKLRDFGYVKYYTVAGKILHTVN